jgi:hypothetical protein
MNEERDLPSLLDRLHDDIKTMFKDSLSVYQITRIIKPFRISFKDYSDNLNKNGALFIFIKEIISELQNDIDNQPSEDNGVIPEAKAYAIGTKIAIAGGTLLVIGIALAWIIYDKQNKKGIDKSAKNIDTSNKHSESSTATNKAMRIFNTDVGELLKNSPPPIDYQLHHLLLIIPANQSDGFKNGQQINNEQVSKLIANTVRAYCFAGERDATNEITVGVKSDDDERGIDNTTESRVFVHLLLSAEPSIIDERIRLNISDKIEPNTTIEIVKIAKLQTARSTTAFYEI